jgi:hypothetical protein
MLPRVTRAKGAEGICVYMCEDMCVFSSRTQTGRQTASTLLMHQHFPVMTQTQTQTQTHALLLQHHIAHDGRVSHGPNVRMCCQKFSNVSVLVRQKDRIPVQRTFQNIWPVKALRILLRTKLN